jgi:hypothetical protein
METDGNVETVKDRNRFEKLHVFFQRMRNIRATECSTVICRK